MARIRAKYFVTETKTFKLAWRIVLLLMLPILFIPETLVVAGEYCDTFRLFMYKLHEKTVYKICYWLKLDGVRLDEEVEDEEF